MKIAYFDCFAGIAGDMVLGAFLDCGVPLDALKEGLSSLPVSGWDIEATPVLKGGIHGLKVRVSHGGHSDEEELAARNYEPVVFDSLQDDLLEYAPEHAHVHQHIHGIEQTTAEQLEEERRFFDAHHDVELSFAAGPTADDAGEHAHPHDHAHAHPHEHPHEHGHTDGHDEHDHDEHGHSHHDHSHDHGPGLDQTQAHEHHDSHEHGDAHDREHSHGGHAHAPHSHAGPGHAHAHSHAHAHGRSMAEIRALIEASALSPRVKATALDVFGRIAVVEAELHHSTPDEIHFHEIGGVDSLIDICGAAWCLEYLGVEAVHCSALPYSTGTVRCAHGVMPVPAPATLKLLRGAPMIPTGLMGEMITPTGAGILAALAKSFGDPPAFTPTTVGFGAGTKDWPDRPNLLRITIGETADTARPVSAPSTAKPSATEPSTADGLEWRTLTLLETNVDDMNPELWSHVFDRLFAAGALDAWLTPAQMKKNRPAQMLSVLCEAEQRGTLLETVLRETTSLGVRVAEVQRAALPREFTNARTPWGEVRLKVARWPQGGVLRAAPELDDVARLARESGATAGEIYAAAARAWQNEGVQQNPSRTNGTTSPSTPGPATVVPQRFPDASHQPGHGGDGANEQAAQAQQ